MLFDDKLAIQIATDLLQIKAIQLNPGKPFTWTSGIHAPVYCDNRKILSYPSIRTRVKTALSQIVEKKFNDATVIAGVATAGIAHGALVADMLHLPFVYVRPKPKSHGLQNQIEGQLPDIKKCVVVEDLVSTGKSSLATVEVLRQAGVKVLGLIAVFSYGFDSTLKRFTEEAVPFYHLTDYPTLVSEAIRLGMIHEKERQLLESWRKSPENWQPNPIA